MDENSLIEKSAVWLSSLPSHGYPPQIRKCISIYLS